MDEVLSAHQTPCPPFSLEAILVAAFTGCRSPLTVRPWVSIQPLSWEGSRSSVLLPASN